MVKNKTIVVRIGLILVLCLLGIMFPLLFIVAAWLGWTIYDTLRNPPPAASGRMVRASLDDHRCGSPVEKRFPGVL